DLELCELLSRSGLEEGSGKTYLNYVNAQEAGPRAIMEAFRPVFEPSDGSPATYVLIGSADINAQITIEVARSWWFTRDEGDTRRVLQVHLAHDATSHARRLTEAYPDLTLACDLLPLDLNVDSATSDEIRKAIESNVPDHTTVFIARQSESATLRTVLTLPDELSSRFPIVALTNRSVGTTAALAERVSSGQRPKVSNFAVLDQLCVPTAFMNSLNERLAQTLHKSYLRDRLADGTFDATRKSHREWDDLDEKFKEINRDHAAGIFNRLDHFGYEIRPTDSWNQKPVSWDTEPITFPAEQVEEMAKWEQERWIKSLQGGGWKFGKQFRLEQQRHPDLVPWEELTHAEQEKDREPVRELPRTLARFGFVIVAKDD
ncbi:MAG TPA: RyR domain-containing protein, partial [Acidimicrobiales bacterium]|nr:RyR domain-containing protein [Acidimicrobiales bacterium]